EQVSLGLVQRVLQHLVRERVSIRDIASIVETIAEESENGRDPATIGEAARRRLAPSICSSLADSGNVIRAAALSMALESRLAAAIVMVERGPILGMEPGLAADLAVKLQTFRRAASRRTAIVCSQSLRLPLARFVEALGADIAVLGLAEVVPGYTVNVLETIGANETFS
ncbi:MAG TPA: FHIPEP family type III secretion protein, partial [Candidatus Eremiobacteraceae bacterium]|nr:FHIPEP family type III secretion protein [Candidatus Eremiobacteraceae bacterium]